MALEGLVSAVQWSHGIMMRRSLDCQRSAPWGRPTDHRRARLVSANGGEFDRLSDLRWEDWSGQATQG